jgi:hypothetical protein
MDQAEGLVPERRVRRWRSVAEKRHIVELTWCRARAWRWWLELMG